MQKYLWSLGAASALCFAFVSAAQAATRDLGGLAGKKICWDNGSASTYGRGGKYSNNMTGEGTWSVTAKGLHVHTDRYDYVVAVDKQAGRNVPGRDGRHGAKNQRQILQLACGLKKGPPSDLTRGWSRCSEKIRLDEKPIGTRLPTAKGGPLVPTG